MIAQHHNNPKYFFCIQICEQEVYGEDDFELALLSFTSSFRLKHWMQLMSENDLVPLDSLNLKYESFATLTTSEKHNWALNLKIFMKPKTTCSIDIITPPGMLAVVSWVSERNNCKFYCAM